jgi:hypothetical protein
MSMRYKAEAWRFAARERVVSMEAAASLRSPAGTTEDLVAAMPTAVAATGGKMLAAPAAVTVAMGWLVHTS